MRSQPSSGHGSPYRSNASLPTRHIAATAPACLQVHGVDLKTEGADDAEDQARAANAFRRRARDRPFKIRALNALQLFSAPRSLFAKLDGPKLRMEDALQEDDRILTIAACSAQAVTERLKVNAQFQDACCGAAPRWQQHRFQKPCQRLDSEAAVLGGRLEDGNPSHMISWLMSHESIIVVVVTIDRLGAPF